MTALELAKLFHETYELLAPRLGYVTGLDTKKFDPESRNGRLMVATCEAILEHFAMMNVHPILPIAQYRGTITKDGNVLSYTTDPAWDRLSDEALEKVDDILDDDLQAAMRLKKELDWER